MSRTPSALLLALLLTPRPALAAGEGLAILELRFTAVPEAVSDQIRARVHTTLSDGGYSVTTERQAEAGLKHASIPPGCTVGPCLQRIGQTLDVERAVVGGVSGQGTSYDITLTMLETGGGTVLAQVNQRCDVCNFKEVENAAAVATERLHKQTLVFISTRSTLVVQSVPPRADVLLDGMPAGKTPLRRILPPGAHTFQVATKGYSAASREVQLAAGKTETVRVKLVPKLMQSLADRPAPPRRRRSPRWIKWAVLGTGVVVGGVGGGLLALDGREAADGNRDTRSAGVTMVSLGAAAAVAATLIAVMELSGPTRGDLVR